MPKDTFFNLPEAKRRLIEDTAIDEFSSCGFDNASINRIVAQARIAKGSFYQYFEDKTDLFKHMITRIGEEKIEFMSPVLQNPEAHDFFTMMEALYRSGLAFAKQNPRAALIANQFFKNTAHPIFREIYADSRDVGKEFYSELLNTAIANGEVRPDINPGFIVHILMSLNVSILEYYFEEVQGDDFNMTKLDDDVMDTVKMSLDFMKNGIGVSNTGASNND